MKCPFKNKYCTSILIFKGKKDNFICSGVSKKPTKYKEDIIWLCLKGKLCKTQLEMTKAEAVFIISSLSSTLGEIFSEK